MNYKGKINIEAWHIYLSGGLSSVLALMFPQFEIQYVNGVINLGHFFYFATPKQQAQINTTLLLTTVIVICAVTVNLVLALNAYNKSLNQKKRNVEDQESNLIIRKISNNDNNLKVELGLTSILEQLLKSAWLLHFSAIIISIFVYIFVLISLSGLLDWAREIGYFELAIYISLFKNLSLAALIIPYAAIIGWHSKPKWLFWAKKLLLIWFILPNIIYLFSFFTPY